MKNILNRWKKTIFVVLAVIGPGLITAFANNDAGGIATYSVSASLYGYSMINTLIPITILLLVTQEIGARIAIVTRKGFGDLIREFFGVRISMFIFGLLFIVNFAVILQNLSGLKSALTLLNVDYRLFLPVALSFLFILVIRFPYSRIERFFLFLIFFYLTYVFSAFFSKPEWKLAINSLFFAQRNLDQNYLFTSIAVLGASVTAWGQFFIISSIKDKNIHLSKLKYSRWEIYIGSILTNIVTFFIFVAVAATIYKYGITINTAQEASLAIVPFAGSLASFLFSLGLLVSGFMGCAIVPLTTAYAFSEFFGYEGSLDNTSFKKSALFYSFFIFQISLGTIFIFLPQVSLFKITLFTNFLNGLFLPVIFFFLYQIANNKILMGKYRNNSFQNFLLILSAIVISIASLIGGLGKILQY